MAPEQLAVAEVTARSDIYALGLVLYEVFTGQRALEGANLAELIRKREQSGITPPSAVMRELNPDIDRAIMRCLRPEPDARPGSALVVVAALPGGDPLAAALAAGETPSPEMVAAAGTDKALSLATGASLLALVTIGLVAYGALGDRALLVGHLPAMRSLDVLEDRAREVTTKIGYTVEPLDTAHRLEVNSPLLSDIARTDQSPTRWQHLRNGDLPTIRFWCHPGRRPSRCEEQLGRHSRDVWRSGCLRAGGDRRRCG
jgi:hypothetical protein